MPKKKPRSHRPCMTCRTGSQSWPRVKPLAAGRATARLSQAAGISRRMSGRTGQSLRVTDLPWNNLREPGALNCNSRCWVASFSLELYVRVDVSWPWNLHIGSISSPRDPEASFRSDLSCHVRKIYGLRCALIPYWRLLFIIHTVQEVDEGNTGQRSV